MKFQSPHGARGPCRDGAVTVLFVVTLCAVRPRVSCSSVRFQQFACLTLSGAAPATSLLCLDLRVKLWTQALGDLD